MFFTLILVIPWPKFRRHTFANIYLSLQNIVVFSMLSKQLGTIFAADVHDRHFLRWRATLNFRCYVFAIKGTNEVGVDTYHIMPGSNKKYGLKLAQTFVVF